MAFDARVIQVLIASPGDTLDERNAVEHALHRWNTDRARREQVILLPRRWETAAVPRLGGSPQTVINRQIVDESDVVIALFDSRLGLATTEAVSGTAEEIERSHRMGKPVHVWISNEPLPRNIDLAQIRALRDFQASLERIGLLGQYDSPNDLAIKVRQAIESDLDELGLGPVARRRQGDSGALLRARYERDREQFLDAKGTQQYRTRRARITVANTGDTTATAVTLDIRGEPAREAPELWGDETPDILPDSEFSWPLMANRVTARSITVTITWREGDAEHSLEQQLAL